MSAASSTSSWIREAVWIISVIEARDMRFASASECAASSLAVAMALAGAVACHEQAVRREESRPRARGPLSCASASNC